MFRRNFGEVRQVVKRLYRELSVSCFEPGYFELAFSHEEDSGLNGIPVKGDRASGVLEGKVDRVDIWSHEGQTYYRVIDYKTGHVSFDYSGVYYGLGLQMLIYLFALKEFENKMDHEALSPAGVLYFPARCKSVSITTKDDEAKLRTARENEEKSSGLLLNDPVVIHAMAPDETIRYLPCTVNAKGELKTYVATSQELELLRHHVTRKVSDLADSIYSGKLEPNPYFLDTNHYGCGWCPYKSVCGERAEQRVLDKLTPEMFWDRIREDSNV